eukprot:gene9718-7590_t
MEKMDDRLTFPRFLEILEQVVNIAVQLITISGIAVYVWPLITLCSSNRQGTKLLSERVSRALKSTKAILERVRPEANLYSALEALEASVQRIELGVKKHKLKNLVARFVWVKRYKEDLDLWKRDFVTALHHFDSTGTINSIQQDAKNLSSKEMEELRQASAELKKVLGEVAEEQHKWTALICATSKGFTECIKALLEMGANPEAKDNMLPSVGGGFHAIPLTK